jgi:ureidoacrylate peracid hydrolase
MSDASAEFAVAGYCKGDEKGAIILPAQPEPLAIMLSETALIVVDMQNAYASKNGYLDKAGFDISSTGPVIAQTAKAIATGRKAAMPIVFLQNGWDAKYTEAGGLGSPNWYKSNALKTMRKNPQLMGTLLAKGTWDYELVDELKPQEDDIIIPKTRYSGFYNTNLDSMLRSRGIRNLVFTGIATNVCVESTLRDGFFLEYFGVVLADATYQAGSNVIQESSLFNIATFFGWVSSVEDFSKTINEKMS